MAQNNYVFIIGIDPGKNTGVAVWGKLTKTFVEIETTTIHKAMDKVKHYCNRYENQVFIRFEDARLRKWLKNKTIDQLQGAGSIKRDCTIWEDFLKDLGVPFSSLAPGVRPTKMKSDIFKIYTGWKGSTTDHARDAAMLVFGY